MQYIHDLVMYIVIPLQFSPQKPEGKQIMWCGYWPISRQHSDVMPYSSHSQDVIDKPEEYTCTHEILHVHVVHPMLSFVWMVRMSVVRRGAGWLYCAPLVCFFAVITTTTCACCPAPFCLDLLRQTSKQHLLYMYNQNMMGWARASIGDTIPLSVSLKLSLTSELCLCHSNSVLLVVVKLVVKFIRSGHRI